MDRLLVHIGPHKTATTWLQKHYFRRHPELAAPHNELAISLAMVRPHAFAFDPDEARAELLPQMEAAWDEGKTVVLSNERLSGNPANGGIDAFEMADRTHAMFPQAKVWMNLREQRSIIASYYAWYVRQGGTCRLDRFLEGDTPHKRLPRFRVEYYRYLPLIRHWESHYGDAVHVSLFEDFKVDKDNVMEGVADHVGFTHQDTGAVEGKSNVGLSDRSLRFLRVANRVMPSDYGSIDFRGWPRLPGQYTTVHMLRRMDRVMPSKRRPVREAVYAAIGDTFAEHNRELARHLDMDLAARDWIVAEAEARGPQVPTGVKTPRAKGRRGAAGAKNA